MGHGDDLRIKLWGYVSDLMGIWGQGMVLCDMTISLSIINKSRDFLYVNAAENAANSRISLVCVFIF